MGATPKDLAHAGFDYVVVASQSYQRFFEPVQGVSGAQLWLKRNRDFYEDLFKEGELVWASKPNPDTHAHVNMEIRVYKLVKLANRPEDGKSGGFLRGIFR
jgi:hypothetical protein